MFFCIVPIVTTDLSEFSYSTFNFIIRNEIQCAADSNSMRKYKLHAQWGGVSEFARELSQGTLVTLQ